MKHGELDQLTKFVFPNQITWNSSSGRLTIENICTGSFSPQSGGCKKGIFGSFSLVFGLLS